MSNKLKLIHLFSGVGSPEMALKRLGIPLEIVGYSEIDKYAIQSYKAIHGEDIPNLGDIKQIERLPKCNLLFYGFCCQDISCSGKQKGLLDEDGNQTRSGLLFDVLRLLRVAKQNNELPEIAVAENVKNLVSKKFKPDFEKLLQVLDSLGYNNYWQVLNAKDYGVPQNRERVFVISLRKDIDKRGYTFPEKMLLTKKLKDVLEDEVDEKFYLSERTIAGFLKHNENHIAKGTGFLWKPRDLNSHSSCLRANGALAPTDNTIVVGVKEATKKGYAEATIGDSINIEQPNSKTHSGNRMPKIIEGIRIRKLTPLECWRLMGFDDEDFQKAKNSGVSNSQLYKQAGNSIVTDVLYHIFRKLFIDYNK